MFVRSRAKLLVSVIALTLLVLIVVACAVPTEAPKPAATTAPQPAATSAPAPAATKPAPTQAAGPKRGGKITVALWQSPTTLNGLLGTQTVVSVVRAFIVEGMTQVLGDGTRVPSLAKEVPTVQNGGVSPDGKVVTYNLKEGLVWSDGKPMTCDDFVFLWQARLTPGVGVTSTVGYSEIETIECPSPTKVVVKYKDFYGPYISLFNESLPKHYAGDPKEMKNWAYNRKPLGTGPFKVDEWVADSYIMLSRNPNYREKDKPYLDQVVIRIVPSAEVAMQLLASGEVDVMWNNTEADIPLLEKMAGVKISAPPQIGGERLILNLAENKDPADPNKPHLILNDQRVRQAVAFGINKQRFIDKLLFGKAKPGTTELNAGPYNCTDIKPYTYDPEKAKSLLTQAGWVPGPDGIRVAKGAKVAPDGTRLRLKYSTTSGNKLREDTQVLVVEDMKAIGVEFYIENMPSALLLGTWADASPRRRGNYDIIEYSTNSGIDPHNILFTRFHSKNITHAGNQSGLNETRYSNPKVDELLDAAGKEPDTAKRKVLYCNIVQILYDEANVIYLYQRASIDSYRDRLVGWIENAWDNLGWDSAGWSLK
jgi:peptide/nickel transport system substrate-binding protein